VDELNKQSLTSRLLEYYGEMSNINLNKFKTNTIIIIIKP